MSNVLTYRLVDFHSEKSQQAMKIVKESLVQLGEITPDTPIEALTSKIHDGHPTTQQWVFEHDGRVVGTISLTQDSDRGLPLEKHFSESVAVQRENGHVLCQAWRASLLPEYRGVGLLHAIINICFLHADKAGATHIVQYNNDRLTPMYMRFQNAYVADKKLIELDAVSTVPVTLLLSSVSENPYVAMTDVPLKQGFVMREAQPSIETLPPAKPMNEPEALNVAV